MLTTIFINFPRAEEKDFQDNYGIVFSKETIEKAKRINDALTTMRGAWEYEKRDKYKDHKGHFFCLCYAIQENPRELQMYLRHCLQDISEKIPDPWGCAGTLAREEDFLV